MPEVPPFSPTIALMALASTWEAAVAETLKPLGLTPRKLGLLGHIGSEPGLSFSELARRSRVTVQTAHAATAVLVDAGLVEDGTAHAGSASTLQVSAAGRRALDAARSALHDVDERFRSQHPGLTDELRRHVDAVMQAAADREGRDD